MNWFLKALKPFYEAGFIQLLAATGTFTAVIVALWPHWIRSRRRPRFQIEIENGYSGETSERVGPLFHGSLGGQAPITPPRIIETVVKIKLRNVGGTAALGVRMTATQFYLFKDGECSPAPLSDASGPRFMGSSFFGHS